MPRKQKTTSGQGCEKIIHTIGFGVPATSDPHQFRVSIPQANKGKVLISEDLGLQANDDEVTKIDRVILERPRWTAIRGKVRRTFNARLKAHGLNASDWKVGDNSVDRLLGKELCVLAWSVENLEMNKIPVAVRNWLALRPEERWWLFGMTTMASGEIKHAGIGWRRALRYALGDVPQDDVLQFREKMKSGKTCRQPTLNLLNDEA